uniref:Putative peptidase family m13 n=1 Tax=Rhipicephalus microplus TaxID=6941 RepID=A0A6G5A0Y9_RHIMP
MNDDILNKLYQFVPKIGVGSSFVEHYFYLRENDRNQKLLKLTSTYINKSHEEVTLRSHAFFDEKTDTAGYPASSLVTHFRKPPIPRGVNYGTVGTIFGQILTSVIDRYKKEYRNGTVVKTTFWDDNTTQTFCKNSKCLNNSEQCSDKEGDCYSLSHQKLHDYIGLRVSHMALLRSKSNYTGPFLLPVATLNTEDKIFFTSFGTLYCPYRVNTRKPRKNNANGELVQERAYEEEFSFEDSLNEIVSIYNKFNETFNCTGRVNDTCKLIPTENNVNPGC